MAGNFHVNRQKLAKEIAQVWTEEELRRFAVQKLVEGYKEDADSFNNDWALIFGDGGE